MQTTITVAKFSSFFLSHDNLTLNGPLFVQFVQPPPHSRPRRPSSLYSYYGRYTQSKVHLTEGDVEVKKVQVLDVISELYCVLLGTMRGFENIALYQNLDLTPTYMSEQERYFGKDYFIFKNFPVNVLSMISM